jgi:hypothetical protein
LIQTKRHQEVGTIRLTGRTSSLSEKDCWRYGAIESTKLTHADGGGGKAFKRHVFKGALQKLADGLGLKIRIAHDPPYCAESGIYVTSKKVTTDFLKNRRIILNAALPR